jgi:hypothetical protein
LRVTKLIRLQTARAELVSALATIDYLIDLQKQRKHVEAQVYEQKKARGQCTAAKSCKKPLVNGKLMCDYHLLRAAQASNRRHVNAPARQGVEVKKWRYQQRAPTTLRLNHAQLSE